MESRRGSEGPSVVIWGEVLWDRLPGGDKLGGAPSNVAFHLGQAGGRARLVTRVGDDAWGRRAIAKLATVVDTSLVQIDAERATGEVGVSVVDGEARYRLFEGRAWERIACTPEAAHAIAHAGALVFGTLAQRTPEGRAAWQAAIAASTGAAGSSGSGALRVCDVNLRKVWKPAPPPPPGVIRGAAVPMFDESAAVVAAIESADVVKVNDQELAVLASWFGWTDPAAQLAAGRRLLAVTHGAKGSTLYEGGRSIEVAATPAQGGDNVGCGDAYLAILVLGLIRGWDLTETAHAASRWAGAVAAERGATPDFAPDRVAELLGPLG